MRQSNQSLRFRRIGFLKCSSTKRRRVWRPCQLLAGLVTAWLILGGIVIAAGQQEPLEAGAARKDITPTKPVTLSGYAGRNDLSQGVHDPLTARAIAFRQNGKRLVLVSTDLIGFYGETSESIRKAIASDCQLQPSELFLTAIHTHSGPTPTLDSRKGHANNVEYTGWLKGQLVDLVREALGSAVRVQIGVGSGSSPVGVNRREAVKDSAGKRQIRLGRNPSAMTDREVQVLKVLRANTNEAVAVVFVYAMHSTSLGPKNYQISGDVHGLAEQFVERYLGHGVIVPAFAGASGDIDPWYRVLPKFETSGGWVPEPVLMGTMLGEEVVHVSNAVRRTGTGGPIKTAFKTLALPGKPRGKAKAVGDAAPVSLNLTVGRIGDVVDMVVGQQPTVIPWTSLDGFTIHNLVMAIMIPRVRSDYEGNSGICIGTTA